ncbi:transport and Golgi organization protein 1 [Anastrepha obliqua]|uniref:transport and Golgi organization protein 1 n=1 Tax=Anastrepha obliqua TaxID=95512 RepID=UPI0024099991|nr:transport and Golgi organization protein 1 [Anastrepha obliqua]XP_054741706.1 transport and Golgi organization protein 1 [Anastrepha obliqua]
MFGRLKYTTMNSVLVFLGVCCVFLPTSWIAEGLSDFRLCADPECHKTISLAKAKIRYPAGAAGMVSFEPNANIRVKSKSAGKDLSVWGIEVNGREGYAPKNLILENKIFVKDSDLTHIVPVVLPGNKKVPSIASTPQAAALKPSENLAATKEEVDLTTTSPLEQPLDAEKVPITNSAVSAGKDVPAQATPVQPKVEMIDGTAIPVLHEASEKPEINPDTLKEPLQENKETVALEKDTKTSNNVMDAVVSQRNVFDTEAEKDLNFIVKESLGDKKNTGNVTGDTIILNKREEAAESQKAIPQMEEHKELQSNALDMKSAENGNSDDDEDEYEEDDYEDDDEDAENKEGENNITKNNSVENTEVQDKEEFPKLEELQVSNSSAATEPLVNISENVEVQSILKNELETENPSPPNTASDSENKIQPLAADMAQETAEKSNLQSTAEGGSEMETTSATPSIGEEKSDATHDEREKGESEPSKIEVEPLTQPTNDETSTKGKEANVEATTEPSVTESGYQHHVDPREETYDTTTLPTMLFPHTQTPEPQVSGSSEVPEISVSNVNSSAKSEEVLQTVPTEYSEKSPVPNTSSEVEQVQELSENKASLDVTTHYPAAPVVSETISEEKHDLNESNSEQYVPTLPLFQTPTQNELQHHQQQHEHNQQHQQQYADLQQPHHHTHQHDASEASHELTKETELNHETTPFQHSDSNELLHTVYQPEPANEQVLNQPQPADYSQETIQSSANEEVQSDQFEAPTPAPFVEDSQNNNDVNVGSPEETTPAAAHIPSITESTPTAPVADNVVDMETREKDQGLFATILGTVNSFLSNGKKEDAIVEDEQLQRILFPERVASGKKAKDGDDGYCEQLTPNNCPPCAIRDLNNAAGASSSIAGCQLDLNNMSIDMLLTVAGNKMLEMSELLACLGTVAVTCLFFLFVYYCFCNSSREGELLAKLNALERSLLATHKENAILKEDLMGTRNKLSSIEDNSFGSNDMVIALKKELEEELLEKRQLQEHVASLEKELENAAEAGLELNKIVSELLSNQTGDESIISSVEELQKQLNEQQKTILDINANLAEKSRENSELQLMIAEQNARLSGEIASLQQDNDELEAEKGNLQTRVEEVKREFELDITKALEGKNFEIKRLQSELVDLSTKFEAEHTRYQTSLAKVEALEECLRTVRRDPNVNINKVIDAANLRAELLDIQKRYATLKERLDTETDSKKLADEQLQIASGENEKLKHDFHQSEKDKLEAQTRLEVLSNYFKEKETQLQKELSLKEAMWLKQQGETTSTVDRLTTMQEEIQALKSQNDALRAEIEAQLAAHKAQTGTLENRAHETWLAARQSERRYEEARAEATALRRKLTSLAGVGGVAIGEPNFEKLPGTELNNAPSPIHMESPGSPLLGRLPPPPFLPPPFMGPPPPFMGMPPPFVPPGEMRPPPLGRLMSPPPGAGSGGSGGSGHLPPRRGGRYSPNRSAYDDYDDDEDEDDYVDDDDEDEDLEDEEEDERMRQRRRRRGSDINGSWHRDDSYSPPPRAYRSQSPTDSRYNYTSERDLISTYDTETDFEQSPRKLKIRGTQGARTTYRDYSPQPSASSPLNASSNSNAGKKHSASTFNKGHISSGSEKSYNAPPQRHSGKKSGKSAV